MIKTIFLLSLLVFHPVHVTLTSIDCSAKMDSFKVFLKMYYDDFLVDFKMNKVNSGNFDLSGNDTLSRGFISSYINENLLIYVNQKQLSGEIENMKLADGELNLNLLYKSGRKPRYIKVKNLIMTRLYSDQANMMIVKIKDLEEGIKFTPEKTEQTFKVK